MRVETAPVFRPHLLHHDLVHEEPNRLTYSRMPARKRPAVICPKHEESYGAATVPEGNTHPGRPHLPFLTHFTPLAHTSLFPSAVHRALESPIRHPRLSCQALSLNGGSNAGHEPLL